jgi:hypothetical protein
MRIRASLSTVSLKVGAALLSNDRQRRFCCARVVRCELLGAGVCGSAKNKKADGFIYYLVGKSIGYQ